MPRYFVMTSFDPDLTEDPFHEGLGAAVGDYAESRAVGLMPVDRSESDIQIVVKWADEAGDVRLGVFDNYLAGVRHLELEGEPVLVDELSGMLRKHLPVLDPDRHLSADHAALQADPRLPYKLAVGAPDQPDARYAALFDRGLRHPHTEVRRFTAHAISLLGWPQSLESLQKAYASERPGLTKATMGTALAAWSREGVGPSGAEENEIDPPG